MTTETFKVLVKETRATLDNQNPTTFRLEFVKDGINHGGRTYDKRSMTVEEAKVNFVKWCGY